MLGKLMLTCVAVVAASVVAGAAIAQGQPASQATPRILAFPCVLSSTCRQQALYRPRLFTPGSHYTMERTRWTEWTRFGASARTWLFSEFQGQKRYVHTTVVLSNPRRMCGVLTFTRWASGSGDGGRMVRVGDSCFFVIGS